MKFIETPIAGLLVIQIEPVADARGFFARTWCEREFADRGLCTDLAQASIGFNHRRATVRGLHLQRRPFEEIKIVRCTAGSVFDVTVDLRPGSPSFLRHFTVELSARNRTALYIPEGCAHGCQTLEDSTEVAYSMSRPYAPECFAGIRWNDPELQIPWPLETAVISDRDRNLPLLREYLETYGASPDLLAGTVQK